MSKFHDNFRKLRADKGVTQKDIAVLLNVTDRAIQFYEKGEREPTIDKLIILARYFGVSVDYLIGNKEEL